MDVLSQKVKAFFSMCVNFLFFISLCRSSSNFLFFLPPENVWSIIGAWLFPFTAERQKDGNGRRRIEGDGGVRHEESSFCGKNLLALHMANREYDKNSYSNRTMNKMVDESYLTERMNECLDKGINGWMKYLKVHVCSPHWLFFSVQSVHLFGICIHECWPDFFIPWKTLVSVSPVEKMLELWQGRIFTLAPSVSPFFLSLHKPSGACFSGLSGNLEL